MLARPGPATLILGTLVAAVLATSGTAPDQAVARTAAAAPSPLIAPALSRVISVRVFHTRISTVRNSNAVRIGRSLASLRPTWVTGLLRYRRNQYPKHGEVRAWKLIRATVKRRSPGAQFDVVLNAAQYRTPAAIRRTMARLRTKLGNEGWFFDFWSSAFRKHPRMVRAAIDSAHKHGEWIGGNIFGIERHHKPLPASSDFYSVQDGRGFYLNLRAVRELSKRKTILYHLQNNPAHPRSGGCRFIRSLNSRERKRFIRRRAAQQIRYRFRVSYPVLFPECIRPDPHGAGTFLYSYNAFRDPPVARAIKRLLNRHQLP